MSIDERIIKCSVTWESQGLALVNFLAGRFTYRSREEWIERIESGEITLNGKLASPLAVLQLQDSIEYRPGDLPEPECDPDYIVAYEDYRILVIDKPGNLCVHPSGRFYKHTLWYLLAKRYGEVHFLSRLDRETSGLLVAARDKETAALINRKRLLGRKTYLTIVHGDFRSPVVAKGFLVQDQTSVIRKKRAFVTELAPSMVKVESAETRFEPVWSRDGLSLVRAFPVTGRMHQIRATLHSLGYPVAGDKLYGLDETFYLKFRNDEMTEADWRRLIFRRQALHSASLEMIHPVTGEKRTFVSDLPEDLKND